VAAQVFRGKGVRRPVTGALVVLLLLCTACQAARRGPGRLGDGVLNVGVPLSLTGQFAQEARLMLDGYRLCERRVNERGGLPVAGRRVRLKLHIRDDYSEPAAAARIVGMFADRGYHLLLGPYGSPATAVAAAAAERNGQILVNALGASDSISERGYRNTFSVISPASEYASSILFALRELARPQPRRVVFLSADDDFSRSVTRAGERTARSLGMRVLPTRYFRSGATDLSAALTRARKERPDLIIGAVHFAEGVVLVRQSRELGLDGTAIALTVAAATAELPQRLNGLAEGVIGVSQWVPRPENRDAWFGTADDYAAAYRSATGREPPYHAAAASASCLALVLAVQRAGSDRAEPVRSALAALDEPSFFGRIAFDARGRNAYKHMTVTQIQRGRPVPVWPAVAAESTLTWPGAR